MATVELSPRYQSTEVEARWYSLWESRGYFKPQSDRSGKKNKDRRYVIVIPPPNVTGILHMGHALNNSIQDILARWHRMRGHDTLWIPGVDHAGIATQNVVEKKLAKEKKTRHDLGRENFLKEVWKWKEEHGSTITRQLRRLGASCDWSRERFTMDEGLSRAVREAFVTLYERGLIYQGHYIINWCPRCQTALSDEESAHKEINGALYHIKYPIAGKGRQAEHMGVDHIVVATTRPETMLGDTAVAVHPEDERYKHLIGKKLVLPLMEREIPIIADEFVDREFGTGFVKVTPAHDPNDFEMMKRHPEIGIINVLHPNAVINEQGGPYQGMDRFAARKKVVEDLEAQGLFARRDTHAHAVGHCYRCETVVEPYLSRQWFVKMKPLAEKALEAHHAGKTHFYPDRWTKVYTNWLEGIRDWCISRQIWWGHQIPVWYCDACRDPKEESSKGVIVSLRNPAACPDCGGAVWQDPDVLDTWFSSWLWPFSTLGWPEETEDLKYFYPTSDLITAPEIIFFWVARMIMAGLEFRGEAPFSQIYIHGTVRAQSGLKMSKSLGNAIDPLEVIDEMGADALRFSMIMLSAQDVYLSREKFEVGRNFTNKVWNAARFVLSNLQDFPAPAAGAVFDPAEFSVSERWILSRLAGTFSEAGRLLENFQPAQASSAVYHFIWDDFCDWYIELAKPALSGADPARRPQAQAVLFFVLEKTLRLLHPFAPFITEEIWMKMRETYGAANTDWPESLMLAAWPGPADFVYSGGGAFRDLAAEELFGHLQNAVSAFRNLRIHLNIAPSQAIKEAVIKPLQNSSAQVFGAFREAIRKIAKIETLKVDPAFEKNRSYVGKALGAFDLFVAIEGIDFEKERVRVSEKISEIRRWVASMNAKLGNEDFVRNAPAEIVEKEREKLAKAEQELKSNEELLVLFQA